MKLSSCFFSCIISAAIVLPLFTKAQQPSTSLNMIAYEHKGPHQYATVLYMPYYPAYGMISFKSSECNTEIAGYIDPFELKKNKLIVTYKGCKVSFNLDQKNQELSNPTENTICQEYYSKNCSFSQMPSLKQIILKNNP